MSKYLPTFILIFLISGSMPAQNQPEALRQYLTDRNRPGTALLRFPTQVKAFYQTYQYNTAWLNQPSNLWQLLTYLDNAADLGLRKEDYQPDLVKLLCKRQIAWPSSTDSVLADLRITDIAIHFFQDVAFGNDIPDIGYNGLNYSPGCLDIPSLLAAALSSKTFESFLAEIECRAPEYIAVKNKIIQYNKATKDSSLKKNILITSNKVSITNEPLFQKLQQLHLIQEPIKNLTEKDLINKLKEAQRLFSLLDDGVLRSTMIIHELNRPLTYRIEELCRALNTIRWLRCIREQNQYIIIVNIPSANLLVFGKDSIALESRLVVGKKSTRTPTLCSNITEVIVYPYWMVPKKIATRELLPFIKMNTGFLEANNFQVINQQGKIVDPAKINWHALNADYFPYTLRQSTGCDNSLGIIKLNFYNPYTVYLHDTPWKVLFALNKRYFSHGCMRVEQAVELARLVLKEKVTTMDTLIARGCLPDQQPVTIPTPEKVPVFVLYNTAWIDSSATIRFHEDVYNKLPK